ncbi:MULTISPECIES: DinB family protein [Bacillus]|uniref:DinB family protein n=1 Tax=Bacillus TaxID=1386 RepID=UPI001FBA6FE1|nr:MULTISPECIES: DinB family protein [Bacillus]MCJ2145975.1 DinB family protein [Bacillus sp. B19-2]MDN5388121.1 DinB family protein [Bacillus sp. LB7]MEC1021200.1 DinB family protein [Bacillus paralicheniformis]MEC1026325.1 DinB family protein [Bacillus paralicheniformis]MEC1034827.1 DinB family protein [Bacillus paralicheniformis]
MLKNVLLEQFKACYNETTWFVCFQTASADLTESQARQKGEGSENSILEIANHLIFYNERYLKRFKGIPVPAFDYTIDDTFVNKSGLGWEESRQELNTIYDEWIDALSACEEEMLNEPAQHDPHSTWAEILSLLILHNAYHLGQIVTIRKQQKSWDPSKGVN